MSQSKCEHCDATFGDGIGRNYIALGKHMTEKHPEHTFICQEHANQGFHTFPDRDFWRKEANGDRCCSYCGSLSEEDFIQICEEFVKGTPGFTVDTTTKSYKIYARRPNVQNAVEGGIKFYFWHVNKESPDIAKREAIFKQAHEKARQALMTLLQNKPAAWNG